MPERFEGKRALITGGTGGIGSAIALAFAGQECNVTATGHTLEQIKRFPHLSSKVEARMLDVTDDNSIQEVIAGFHQLDILVNCAGTILRQNREHDPADFEKVIDVNLTGAMRLCAACRPLLARSRGCVLNIASMLSFFGSGFVPAYSASKGGLVQLTKSLAIAWAEDGIRVNAIAPGWIETAMTQPLRDDPARNRAILERTPMKRWGKPDDIAGAAVFLCSPQAAFITGAILPVDGGYSCT
ncbi:MAG: SDR family oxidoreductase [Verrucomicrobia bacterium]|nr:SDR family oxidoreductase [Verrucomicrobiota bacterium]